MTDEKLENSMKIYLNALSPDSTECHEYSWREMEEAFKAGYHLRDHEFLLLNGENKKLKEVMESLFEEAAGLKKTFQELYDQSGL